VSCAGLDDNLRRNPNHGSLDESARMNHAFSSQAFSSQAFSKGDLGNGKAAVEAFDGSWSPVTPPDIEGMIVSKEEIKRRAEQELVSTARRAACMHVHCPHCNAMSLIYPHSTNCCGLQRADKSNCNSIL